MKLGQTVRASSQQATDAESLSAGFSGWVGVGAEARLSDTVIAAPRTRTSMMFVTSAMRAPALAGTRHTSAIFGSGHGFQFHGS